MKPLLYLRSFIVTFFFFPLLTVLGSAASIFCAGVLHRPRWSNHLHRIWAGGVCALYGVRVKVRGWENIPKSGAIFLFNHTSFMDIMALYSVFPFVRFGAKIELFKIPVFGWAMRAVGTLPIARSSREKSIRVLQEAYGRAQAGEIFALSPEGGRNTEEKLLPFKAGPFLFAIEAGVPLVPVVIKGAYRIWPKNHFFPATLSWFSEITLDVLEPVSTMGYKVEERSILQAKVRQEMEEVLDQ